MHERILSMEEIAAMGEAIAETAAIIDVATHRFLTQLRDFDRVDGWHRAGALSCAHWLSWRVGMDLGAAREKVRVARKLAELPAIDEALRKGEISYSKVRAMTRVATAANENDLLGMARAATGAQLEKICRLKRMVNALAGESAKDVEERRYVVERATEDGMVSIQLRLLPEEAATVMNALELVGSGNRADGAVALAERALAGGTTEGASVRPPVEVVLHVQAADLGGQTPPSTWTRSVVVVVAPAQGEPSSSIRPAPFTLRTAGTPSTVTASVPASNAQLAALWARAIPAEKLIEAGAVRRARRYLIGSSSCVVRVTPAPAVHSGSCTLGAWASTGASGSWAAATWRRR